MTDLKTDICVIGAGSAGLSVAAGAAQMGARVVLIEKTIRNGILGGDCLHTGCVPSKALIAAAKQAYTMGQGADLGITPAAPQINFAAVNAHVHDVIGTIAPVDSVTRFEELGVKVLEGAAAFTSAREVLVGETRIKAKYFCIATGSSPVAPPIHGLADTPFLTNETIFTLTECPQHLMIIGGGPIGVEMAQAHARLGAKVTLFEGATIMGRDDPDLVEPVRAALVRDGVSILEGARVKKVGHHHQHIEIEYEHDGRHELVTGSHLLVAAGRKASTEGLDLDKAGVKSSPRGIDVDAHLRTSNKRIFALGDVAGGPQFTHVAGYHAGIAIRNMLYRIPAKADHSNVPHVTFADPELAHVGLTEKDATQQYGAKKIRVLTWPYAENDRAQASRKTEGLIKVIANAKGKILGASIVGESAGELIAPWVLARAAGLKISDMASVIAPYPTLGEISKRAAGSFYTSFLFGARNKFLIRTLLKLP